MLTLRNIGFMLDIGGKGTHTKGYDIMIIFEERREPQDDHRTVHSICAPRPKKM